MPETSIAWVYAYSYWLRENGQIWRRLGYESAGRNDAWSYYCTVEEWPSTTPGRMGLKPSRIPL